MRFERRAGQAQVERGTKRPHGTVAPRLSLETA
jgi:hypothetical protein